MEEEDAPELKVIDDMVLEEEEEEVTELTSIVDQAVVEEVISVLKYILTRT